MRRHGGSRGWTDQPGGVRSHAVLHQAGACDGQSVLSTSPAFRCRRAGAAVSAPGIVTRMGRDAGRGSVARRHSIEISSDVNCRAIEPAPSPSFSSETEAPKSFAGRRISRRIASLLYLATISESAGSTLRPLVVCEQGRYGCKVQSGMACPIAASPRSTPK